MKNSKLFILLGFFLFSLNPLQAVVKSSPVKSSKETPVLTDKQQKKADRFTKLMEKVETYIAKKKAKRDIKNEKRIANGKKAKNDNKLLWLSVILWGAGLLLMIIGVVVAAGTVTTGGIGAGAILYVLGGLSIIGGWVTFIIWLVNKLSS